VLALSEEPDHQRRLFVLRAGSADVVAAFTVPSTSVRNVHLSLDGSRVLVEELNPGTRQLTGRLLLYDAASGRPLGTISADKLANTNARFLCITPSGESALYSQESRLNAVSLSTGATVVAAGDHVVDRTNACVTADR